MYKLTEEGFKNKKGIKDVGLNKQKKRDVITWEGEDCGRGRFEGRSSEDTFWT